MAGIGLSKDIIIDDARKTGAVFVIGLAMGIMAGMSAFDMAIPLLDTDPDGANRYISLLLKSSGVLIPAVLGLGSSLTILVMPKRNGGGCRQCDMYSHVFTVMLIPGLAVLTAMSATMIMTVMEGSPDDLPLVVFSYAGMFAEAAGFAAIGTFGYSVSADWRKCTALALSLGIWCVLCAVLGSFSLPGVVSADGEGWMSFFWNLSFTGLVDVGSLMTLAAPSPDMTWFWKYLALALVEMAVFVVSHFYCKAKDNY